MAVRGRSPGYHMGQEHRDKIRNSNVLHRLIACAEGKVRMDGAQVTAAIALLKKVMPDLASVEQTGEQQKPVVIVTGVPRPWDKPIEDSSALQPNDSNINSLAGTKVPTEH